MTHKINTVSPITASHFSSDEQAAAALHETDRENLRDLSIVNRPGAGTIAAANFSGWGQDRIAKYADVEHAKLAALVDASFRLGTVLEDAHFDRTVETAWS